MAEGGLVWSDDSGGIEFSEIRFLVANVYFLKE
jgi:hypothetical protein